MTRDWENGPGYIDWPRGRDAGSLKPFCQRRTRQNCPWSRRISARWHPPWWRHRPVRMPLTSPGSESDRPVQSVNTWSAQHISNITCPRFFHLQKTGELMYVTYLRVAVHRCTNTKSERHTSSGRIEQWANKVWGESYVKGSALLVT